MERQGRHGRHGTRHETSLPRTHLSQHPLEPWPTLRTMHPPIQPGTQPTPHPIPRHLASHIPSSPQSPTLVFHLRRHRPPNTTQPRPRTRPSRMHQLQLITPTEPGRWHVTTTQPTAERGVAWPVEAGSGGARRGMAGRARHGERGEPGHGRARQAWTGRVRHGLACLGWVRPGSARQAWHVTAIRGWAAPVSARRGMAGTARCGWSSRRTVRRGMARQAGHG